MIIAHLADLHISKYGAKMTAIKNGRIKIAKGGGWQTCWREDGWRIDARHALGRWRLNDAFRLVDHEGRVHQLLKSKKQTNQKVILNELIHLKTVREKTSSMTLARKCPTAREIKKMLAEDPDNGNVRFCAVAKALEQDKPDWIVITGDLTDDGIGYELVRSGLKSYIKAKRLICIPGNHDLYPTPPIWTAHALRKSNKEKHELWSDFVKHLNLPERGSYVMALSDNVLLAYFDSCYPGRLPASSTGHIPVKDLNNIKNQMKKMNPNATRLACLHHPVLNMTYKELGLINLQPGMKLRNSKKVLESFKDMGFSVVMKGHRHVGYKYHLKEGPTFLSAPSTTYGCRSGAKPFYWNLDIRDHGMRSIKKRIIPLLAEI